MASYLMKYKGTYRLKVELDQSTNDFVRDEDGSVEDVDVYIDCQHGSKIFVYGHINNTRPVWLWAYIPSIIRGHKIVKELKENNIELIDVRENDEEVEFKFKASDIEIVAELMKARTYGAGISPFSTKNLPKTNVEIPIEKMALYKEITNVFSKGEFLIISRITNDFIDNIMQKSLCGRGKRKIPPFDIRKDMREMKLSRQLKEYIYVKGYWEEYLDYLKKEIEKNYK